MPKKQTPSNKTPKAKSSAARPTDIEISLRAYAIFLERGGAHGSDVEDWLRAERELASATAPAAPAAPVKPARTRSTRARSAGV